MSDEKKKKQISIKIHKIKVTPLCKDRWKTEGDKKGFGFDRAYEANFPTRIGVDDLGDMKEILKHHPILGVAIEYSKKWPLSYRYKKGDIAFFELTVKSSKYGTHIMSHITGLDESIYKQEKGKY